MTGAECCATSHFTAKIFKKIIFIHKKKEHFLRISIWPPRFIQTMMFDDETIYCESVTSSPIPSAVNKVSTGSSTLPVLWIGASLPKMQPKSVLFEEIFIICCYSVMVYMIFLLFLLYCIIFIFPTLFYDDVLCLTVLLSTYFVRHCKALCNLVLEKSYNNVAGEMF